MYISNNNVSNNYVQIDKNRENTTCSIEPIEESKNK